MTLNLQGMSDETYIRLLSEVDDIRFLFVKIGSMATKTAVEEVLMSRYGSNRSDAHVIVNMAENANSRAFMIGANGAQWRATRPMPRIEDWPEVAQCL